MSATGGRSSTCKGDHAGRLGTRALQCSWQQRRKQRRRRARTWHGKRRRCAQQRGRQHTYRHGRSRGCSLPQAAQAAPRACRRNGSGMCLRRAHSHLPTSLQLPCWSSCTSCASGAAAGMGVGPAVPLPRPAPALLGRSIACSAKHKLVLSADAGWRSRGQRRRSGGGAQGGPRHWADAGTSRAHSAHGGGDWLGLHGQRDKRNFTQSTSLCLSL